MHQLKRLWRASAATLCVAAAATVALNAGGSAAAREPSVRIVAIDLVSRLPSRDRIDINAVIESSRSGDEVSITVESYSTCSASVPDRAERYTDVLQDTVETRTLRHRFAVPRAARHEITLTLVATDRNFGTTREMTDFGSIKEGCR